MGIRHSLVFSDPKSRQFVPRTRNLTKKNTSTIIFSLLFSFLLSHFMWILFQLYVHNIWYRFANNVIWHWITSMITVLFQIVSCWIVEIVNSQSSSSSEWDSDARKLVCLVGNPCDHPSHRVAKSSSTNNSQDYHHDDNDDHRTFILTNNAKRSRNQTQNLNLFKMLGSKRVIRSQFPIWLRVKCSDPGEWVSNSTKVPFISFLSSAKHCKFATNVSLGLFQMWLIHSSYDIYYWKYFLERE